MAFKKVFSFGGDLWDPSYRFVTSWLIGPWLLFACRALISLYCFATLFFSIGWTCTHDALGGCPAAGREFSYFTIITFWGIAFYFLVAAVHTLTYALQGRPLLDRFPRALQALHSLFYTTIVTYPFLVTIVFWIVLFSGDWFPLQYTAWKNVSQHALNSAFALFEIFIPRTNPPLWIHMLWIILILAGYLALAFVTYVDQGFYTYSFLDYEEVGGRGMVAAYVFGVAAGGIVIFLVVWFLIWLRKWITERKLGLDGKFAGRRNRQGDIEMDPVRSNQPYKGPAF
ncbi:hypothetical protein S40288_06498 [Stachybotrys chartarum IBT 40288]|nr:hypothetical protein S40288_06498 [Stachybotrys chartarum IBT 40288]